MTEQTSAHYYAATSTTPLVEVCSHLRRVFNTEPFEFDSHAHWEYGSAAALGLALNITRCSDCETIETWIEGTPRGVNYQAVVWCPDAKSEVILPRFAEEFESVLGCGADHFRSSPGSHPAGPTGEPVASPVAPSSGFSLPFTWLFAAGLVTSGVIVVRSCSG